MGKRVNPALRGGMALAAAAASIMAAAPADAGGVSFSIGAGFVFGGGGCGSWGGWGGPVISIGTAWSSDCRPRYDRCGDYGYGGYWSRPYRPYYAPRYCAPTYYAPAYCPPSYYGASSISPAVTAEARVQLAAAPRPAAPIVPAESNTQRGWRLLEADRPGAMEAFGKAVARSESADAYLGYSICAARAGQAERAEWAARTAMKKDAQVLAKAPAGKGVTAAAAAALARYTQKTRGRGEAAEFTVAVLSDAAGDATGATDSASRLVGGDIATTRLVAAVGVTRAVEIAPAAKPVGAMAATPSAAKAMPSTLPARRVVVAVKPDGK